MQILHYTKARSLDEAWELNQQRNAVILGGCCWLRLSPQRMIKEAIDLSDLGLNAIEETESEFRLGAMVTLRQLEQSAPLAAYTQGAMKECVRHIVGTQFRNMATLGGSIAGRFGFSDLWTLFLALRAQVVLYKGGTMPLAEFSKTGAGKDIVTQLIVPKTAHAVAYDSLRLNATDFPIIACAMATYEDGVDGVVGAKPSRAEGIHLDAAAVAALSDDEVAAQCAAPWKYETNMRGSAAYRKAMATVLCRRLWQTVKGGQA